jgi:dUTP pyrophosphatase
MLSESDVYLRLLKLTQHALTPTQEAAISAGFYLRSQYDTTVPVRRKELIKTELQIKLSGGCYVRVAPGMDLELFHHIDIGVGLVDEHFRSNFSVLLFNHTENPLTVPQGDKIAKLIYKEMYYPELDLVNKTV